MDSTSLTGAPRQIRGFEPRMNSYIYVYSNETGKQVDAIEAATPEECLALATEKWNTNDFHFSSRNVEISNAI
jgi:hypothetical protein